MPQPEKEPPEWLLKGLERAKNMQGKWGGQCVAFIQKVLGTWETYPEFRGAAGTIEPTSTTTVNVGDAVLTDEGPHGHVALVMEIDGDELILIESNFSKHNDEIVRVGRRLNKDDERIRGYFNF